VKPALRQNVDCTGLERGSACGIGLPFKKDNFGEQFPGLRHLDDGVSSVGSRLKYTDGARDKYVKRLSRVTLGKKRLVFFKRFRNAYIGERLSALFRYAFEKIDVFEDVDYFHRASLLAADK
jgi:hypothetical protein